MKKFAYFMGIIITAIAALSIVGAAVRYSAPNYMELKSFGWYNYTEKITGRYIVEKVANYDDTVAIFGSSELRTFDIPTHPSNVFYASNEGFDINIVGRGSCQAIIHALNIASNGEALSGKKVVLITSPQSYVPEGIAPDLFMANFSEQQYLHILNNPGISDEIKARFSERIAELTTKYESMYSRSPSKYTTTGLNIWAYQTGGEGLQQLLIPFNYGAEWLLDVKDVTSTWLLAREVERNGLPINASITPETYAPSKLRDAPPVDWNALQQAALEDAIARTDNNEFGILNDYYNTYIGRRLEQQEGKDAGLSYTESVEYDDLRLLMDVCSVFGIEPLFVHVPMHGAWSDYTGFTSGRRSEYYEKVRRIIGEYPNATLLDLTGYEYEEYFLCDIMHLGWLGWLEVDRAICEYFGG